MHKALIAGMGALGVLSAPAAAWVSVHVETSAATQAMIAAGGLIEGFDAPTSGSFRSTFGGSGFGATFTGFSFNAADASGSAFGASPYASTATSATVKLDRSAQFLSFRTPALDGRNVIELFSNGTSLGTWSLVDSAAAAGFRDDPARYASPSLYVNFFTDLGFDEIRFTQSAGRFAMDDFTVNRVTAVPEVQTWTMLILGFGTMGAALRWRRRRRAAAA